MKKIFLLLFVLIVQYNLYSSNNFAYHTIIDDVISPVSVNYLIRTIEKCEADGAQFLIIQLDTPGGLVESTRVLIKKMLNTGIPIIVYVAPSGARAASAGAFIAQAADIVVMSSNTRIGAAHPVVPQQKLEEHEKEKVTNDLVAYIRNLAKQNNRNEDWAEKAVRESATINEEEALDTNVINFISDDLNDLLEQINGFEIPNKNKIINTTDIEIKKIQMGLSDLTLSYIANPNVAYLLLTIGIYGLIYEFASPGFGFAGVTGVISLLLAFAALQFFPINFVGLLLIIAGTLFFILETRIQSFGILTIGGIVSILFGSLMLIDISREFAPFLVPSISIIIGTVSSLSLVAILLIYFASKTFNIPVSTGDDALIGKKGVCKTSLTPEGFVLVFGERWLAVSHDLSEIAQDSDVEVLKVVENKLVVKKIELNITM